jgi:hypothetical protein
MQPTAHTLYTSLILICITLMKCSRIDKIQTERSQDLLAETGSMKLLQKWLKPLEILTLAFLWHFETLDDIIISEMLMKYNMKEG